MRLYAVMRAAIFASLWVSFVVATVSGQVADSASGGFADEGIGPGVPDTCGVSMPEGSAAVTGTVRDSASGVALPGARVSLTWDQGPDLPVGNLSTSTDERGSYVLCPVPTAVPLAASSTFPRLRAEAVVTLPPSSEILRLDFRLTGQDSFEDDRPSSVTLLPTGPGERAATVTGTVRDRGSGAPLVGAQVSVPDLGLGTVTEPGGRFRLAGIPPGEHTVRVEHLGYRTAETALVFEEVSDFAAVAWLSPRAIAMDALEVRARSEPDEVIRRSGATRYRITRAEIEKRPSASIAEILRSNVPGMRVTRDRRGCPALETRRGASLIVVDGVPFRDGCVLDEIDSESIESVDVLSTAAASTRWGSLGGSGVVEITTRRR